MFDIPASLIPATTPISDVTTTYLPKSSTPRCLIISAALRTPSAIPAT